MLQWALSLPEGSRETFTSIGEQMPEGRIAIRKARQQLVDEGFVHTRQWQCPETGRWETRVLVSNVALTSDEEIAAAFAGQPGGRILPAGKPAGRAVGDSPKGVNTPENTPHPPEPGLELGRAARVLAAIGAVEPRLRLGAAEAVRLAPLAEEWFARGAGEAEIRDALTAGLPRRVHAPGAIAAYRLRAKLPAKPVPPVPPPAECGECRDPLPRGQESGICGRCAGVAPPEPDPVPVAHPGPALVRAAFEVARDRARTARSC
ncbi:hypothetical protein [Streptomyces gobiensis]|uniref:hypothetical protein n=1 Tax=Streptomyces gobiensis TaxID=2875706 RepID=UPI001E56E463|nr:hypothetical protein [Streptomyces gobiensis]UGY95026.1 hypothetical protein test1122_05275 [Streptomyces gobiensis]